MAHKLKQCIILHRDKLLALATTPVESPTLSGHNANNINDSLLSLPLFSDIKSLYSYIDTPIFENDTEFVASIDNDQINLRDNGKYLQFINLRQALNHFNPQTISHINYYYQLRHYYQRNKFCGSCGNPTTRNTTNKFITCTMCQHEIYPHIAPCIIVRIHKGSQILMARGVNFLPNAWGLIAGFVEINECLEDAVMREVKEEVGIEIHNLKYWGSQPWSFPTNSILVCFTADYKSGVINPDPTEIDEAGFFDRHNIPGKPSTNYSITSSMINEWVNN